MKYLTILTLAFTINVYAESDVGKCIRKCKKRGAKVRDSNPDYTALCIIKKCEKLQKRRK